MNLPAASGGASLVAHLEDLARAEKRGALASLRRGLGKEPGTVSEMFPHVEPYLGSANRARADAGYVVASLFGLHPVPWQPTDTPWNTSLGWSLRRIRFRDDGGEDAGVARRLIATMNSERQALPTHLRHVLTLLRSRVPDAAVNWERLLWDVVDWNDADRGVQRRWAEAFWRGDTVPPSSQQPPDPTVGAPHSS